MNGGLTDAARALGKAVLVVALVGGIVYASETVAPAHLTSEKAYRIALVALANYGVDRNSFKLPTPEYKPDTHKWMVTFIRTNWTSELDGELVVVFVDDASGTYCIQHKADRGPCT